MPYYRSVGEVPPKRHTRFSGTGPGRLSEELMGEDGFSAESALLYHRGVPAAIVDSQVWDLPDGTTRPNHPLRPRHFRLPELTAADWRSVDAVTGRRLVVGNSDVALSYVVAGRTSPLYRNAVGDECVFVEAGRGRVETVFGSLTVSAGDYVLLPRGTTHRWLITADEPLRLYCIQATGHVRPPGRYLSPHGQFLESAPYCERDLRVPDGPLLLDGADVPVYVRHRLAAGRAEEAGSVLAYQSHPFDVVGWDGCLYPVALNVADFEPITGRVHQPPPVHQVFEGAGF
ncbi:MAG: cupin domain-containing protein, partial [Mycobacteriales bacterium]